MSYKQTEPLHLHVLFDTFPPQKENKHQEKTPS